MARPAHLGHCSWCQAPQHGTAHSLTRPTAREALPPPQPVSPALSRKAGPLHTRSGSQPAGPSAGHPPGPAAPQPQARGAKLKENCYESLDLLVLPSFWCTHVFRKFCLVLIKPQS